MNFNQSRVATLAGVISMFFFSFFGLIFLRYINLIAFVQRRGTLNIMCASHMICALNKKKGVNLKHDRPVEARWTGDTSFHSKYH